MTPFPDVGGPITMMITILPGPKLQTPKTNYDSPGPRIIRNLRFSREAQYEFSRPISFSPLIARAASAEGMAGLAGSGGRSGPGVRSNISSPAPRRFLPCFAYEQLPSGHAIILQRRVSRARLGHTQAIMRAPRKKKSATRTPGSHFVQIYVII